MKLRYLSILCSIFGFLGCDDFLDETPEDFQTPQSFFQNEQQLDEAVSAIYNTNRDIINSVHWRFGENRSDNTSFQFNPSDRGGIPNEEVDLFLMLSANPNIAEYWNKAYSGIARANFALENLDNVEYSVVEEQAHRRGEILFLRSWFYFNLVQLYGDVPYATSAGDSPGEILSDEFLNRVSAAQVYENILADTQEAIGLLPNRNETDTGRATRGAGLMLKAKMHMAIQQFAEARPLLEEIQVLGYSLLPDYASIFDPENKNNAESIFEIQYDFGLGQGSDFVSRFVPFNSGSDILGENGPAGSRAGQNQPTQSLIDLYDPMDPRFTHNISFYDNGTVVEPWMSKFNYGFVALGNNTQNINYPMFRYADALLMLAEVYNEIGGGNATQLVEQVRQRSLPGVVLTPEEEVNLSQTIADERRRELAFENHRYFDLLRTGQLVAVMTAHGIAEKALRPTVPPEAYTNIRTVIGLPLGQVEEFDFIQNEGW